MALSFYSGCPSKKKLRERVTAKQVLCMPHRSTDRIAGSEDEKYNLRMGLDHLM
jgi:hypothetical protein